MKRIFSIAMTSLLLTALFVTAIRPLVSADATNLIANPSAETLDASGTPSDWTADKWGTNTTTLQTTTDAHSGTTALSITTTARTDGDAKWTPDAVSVTGGQTYTYTDYYKATVGTELDAAYTDANGTVTYTYLGGLNASTGWQLASTTFTVPVTAQKVSVLHILAAVGSLTMDDASLAAASTTTTTPTPPTTPTTGNLMTNPSFESSTNGNSPDNWQTGSWGTNDAVFSYLPTGHTGNHSVSVTITSYTSGDAKWYMTPIAIAAGQTYTYSDYYQSAVPTQVMAVYTSSTGATTYVSLPDAPLATSWNAYTAQLTVPAGTATMTIYHLLAGAGTLTLDDVSLVTSATAPTPPTQPAAPLTIANASVETSTNGTTPDDWQNNSWGTNTSTFSYVTDAHTGTHSVKTSISKYTSGDAKWFFAPVTGLQDGASYSFSAWLKASTQVHATAAFTMPDGSIAYETLALPLGVTSTTWKQYTTDFTAPTGAKDVTVYLLIESVGWVETDDYSLTTYTPTGFNEGLVSIDFDDGWSSIYTNGLPLLKKYGLPSTQYIISGKIGTSQYMTKAQIKAFQTQGSEIGSHSVTHPDLTTVTASQLTTELQQAQKTLRADFGTSVATEFATPYGSYNDTVLTQVKKYYVSQRSTDVGFNSKDNFNPYNIVVQNVEASTSVAQVEAWVAQAKAQKTWLVLVYHQVENTVAAADTDAIKTANLNTELSYIKSSGITVKTQSAALTEVTAQLK